MANLTFEQLPEAVSMIHQRLDTIEQLLHQLIKLAGPAQDELMTVTQAAEFISLSV